MYDSFKNLNEILSGEKEFDKFRTAISSYEVIERFSEIFPELNKIIVPVKIVKSVLFLRVDNSVWRSELNFRREILIKKINVFFKKEIVKSIKFI
jgi:hypothetical protein